MSKIEEEIEGMFPMQREVIARATLAGCRFVRHEDARRIGGFGSGVKKGWVPVVTYSAFLPDGMEIHRQGGWEDVYSAALACEAVLNYVRSEVVDEAFVLERGNEQ